MVNRGMLTMLQKAFPGEVECYASKSTFAELDLHVCKRVCKLPINTNNGKLAVLSRYLISTFHNLRLLVTAKRGDVLFYNLDNVFSIRMLDMLNRWKKAEIFTVCHGELDYLTIEYSGLPAYRKMLSKLVRGYFNKRTRPAAGMHFIILGDRALQTLKQYISPELADRFESIDHPVIGETRLPEQPYSQGRKLRVGTVGILNGHKGSDLYLELLDKMNDCRDKVEFYAVGHIQCDPRPFVNMGVRLPENLNEPVPKGEFLRKISKFDFLLYFYTDDKYKLTASGALLDAIRMRKPIIALRNDYFEYIFNKYGPLGYLVDSVGEMAELLRHPEKLKWDFDYQGIGLAMSPESLQARFDEIIGRPARPGARRAR